MSEPSQDPSAEGPAEERAGVVQGQLRAQATRIEELSRVYATLLEDNKSFRQRVEREGVRQSEADRARVVQALIETADDLGRVLATPAASEDARAPNGQLVQGVRLSLALLDKRIAALGAERLALTGLPFDPNLAEAVEAVPVADVERDGLVLEEVRPGYRLGTRLLRPAAVRVGRLAQA